MKEYKFDDVIELAILALLEGKIEHLELSRSRNRKGVNVINYSVNYSDNNKSIYYNDETKRPYSSEIENEKEFLDIIG